MFKRQKTMLNSLRTCEFVKRESNGIPRGSRWKKRYMDIPN